MISLSQKIRHTERVDATYIRECLFRISTWTPDILIEDFIVFLSPFKKMPGYELYWAITAPFQSLSYILSTSHPTIDAL
jgi:hypothetical protein